MEMNIEAMETDFTSRELSFTLVQKCGGLNLKMRCCKVMLWRNKSKNSHSFNYNYSIVFDALWVLPLFHFIIFYWFPRACTNSRAFQMDH